VISVKLEVPSTCLWYVVDLMPSCCKFIPLLSGPGVHSFCSTYGLHSSVCLAFRYTTLSYIMVHMKSILPNILFFMFFVYM